MFYNDSLIVKPVPKRVRARCKWYMEKRFLSLHDAFNEAVREYPKPSKELKAAFMSDNYREYIPSAYVTEYFETRYSREKLAMIEAYAKNQGIEWIADAAGFISMTIDLLLKKLDSQTA